MMTSAGGIAIAAVCFTFTAGLGVYVSSRLPPRIDTLCEGLRGRGTPLAAFFTLLGRWYVLAAVAAVVAIVDAMTGRSTLPIAVLFASEVLAQGAISGVKAVVRRARPAVWVLRLEADSSYPSGHAATAVVFFGGLLGIVDASALPRPAAFFAIAALGICIAGIPWSRLVLGAHYATDVLGGLFFGAGWLLVTIELYLRFAA